VTAALWPLLYLPSLAGLVLAATLLWVAQRPRLWRLFAGVVLPWRRRPTGEGA